ncbi:MAG: hypothetical protein IKF29_00410 [Oceanobacillus sp.]|nr:hypothetical protein [Oceanobacillus sp.]
MKLIIDIPDKDYEFIKNAHVIVGRRNGKEIEYNIINAIKNGTPLKGLIDEKEEKQQYLKKLYYPNHLSK